MSGVFENFNHTATATTNGASTETCQKTLAEMIEIMRDFRHRTPRAIIVGRGTLFDLEMISERRKFEGDPRVNPFGRLDALEVRYDDDVPPNWLEIEYADGHRERVYWFGKARGEG